MSHPIPGHEYGENEKPDFKKKSMAKKMKKGGLLGKLEQAVEESKQARGGNWRGLLGKKK